MFLLKAEAERVKGHISELQLLCIVDGINLYFPLRETATSCFSTLQKANVRSLQEVVVGVSAHEHKVLETLDDAFLDELEEDVVAALVWLLVSHPRFLEKVDVNVATGKLSHMVEVDPDELSKP